MAESIRFSIQLPVYPERVYRAWLDGGELQKITQRAASVQGNLGGKFSLLEGEVAGEFLTLTPHDRVVQTWRDQRFPSDSPASQVELRFEPTCGGTELVLEHTQIPDGKSMEVLQRWENELFRPMLEYFDEIVGEYVADMGEG